MLAICLLCAIGCQGEAKKPETYADLLTALEANAGQSFACTIQRIFRMDFADVGDIVEIVTDVEFLFEKQGSASLFTEISAFPLPTSISFSRWRNGYEHKQWRRGRKSKNNWDCKLYEPQEFALGVVGLFPEGGLNLFSQVQGMMNKLGPTEISISGSTAELSWAAIPKEIRMKMLSQYGIYERKNPGPLEVRLSLDFRHGHPTSIEIYFGKGESVITKFGDFRLLHGSYSQAAADLEAEAGVPTSTNCECDFYEMLRNG